MDGASVGVVGSAVQNSDRLVGSGTLPSLLVGEVVSN